MLRLIDIAKHLDMSDRNARDVLKRMGEVKAKVESDWWKKASLNEIRVWYIQDLREKAAGRGGNDQVNLSKQRAEESAVKTAMMRLDYHEKIGTLVPAADAASVIVDWCAAANREFRSGISKLKEEIQSEFKIKIPNKMVESIAGPTVKRIQDHAQRIGRDLDESGSDVQAANDCIDSRVAN